jgi:hypothetical protein
VAPGPGNLVTAGVKLTNEEPRSNA